MRSHAFVFTASIASLCLATNAAAVGFALEQQSVSNMGYAFAGGAASAEDASTIFWNPAGMTRLPRRQAVLGLNAIYGDARFSDRGTTSPAGPAFPVTGGGGGNPVGLNWVPNRYFATDFSPAVKAGIGINSPFGLETKYPSDWMGRYHAIDSVLADLTWTRWSKFNELRVRFDNGAPDAVTPENWRNTVRVSLGAGYKLDGRWTLRGGVAYENSPVRDEFRTPRIPDNAHTLVGLGANCTLSQADSFDFAYMHAFVKDAPVNVSTPAAGTLSGTYEVSADVVSVQYNHNF